MRNNDNMNEEQQYINFDEYVKASEPHKRERAEAWRVAIGLQAVDGLQTSEYLQETARRNIEGEITIDEARELVKYRTSRGPHFIFLPYLLFNPFLPIFHFQLSAFNSQLPIFRKGTPDKTRTYTPLGTRS